MSTNDSTAILRVEGIKLKGFEPQNTVPFNFELREDENWILVGPSGSGKTQLLEFLAGKIGLVNSNISYEGLADLILSRKKDDELFNWHKLVAYVPFRHQFRNRSNTTSFYYQQRFNASDSGDAKTVQELLDQALPGYSQAIWTLNELITKLDLSSLLEKEVIKLSNGETRRVLLALAIVKEPKVLLLDNPFMGLDTEKRARFEYLLQEISNCGVRIIMAHSVGNIPCFATHVAIFGNGHINATFPAINYTPALTDSLIDGKINEGLLIDMLSGTDIPPFNDIVKMRNVAIRYGEKQILKDINWSVRPGERWALLGENGAGKSTLLSLINGDNPQAYSNDIVLFDRKRGSGESIWDIKKNIGFVSTELFQYFPSSSSCLQVVESGYYDTLGLFRPSHPARRQTSSNWLNIMGIEHLSTKLFKNISAGEQRLCLLARAMVKMPPLLIFDEPCQGLDQRQQALFKRVTDLICGNSQIALIYVSHYEADRPACVKNIIQLKAGEVIYLK